MERKLCWKGFAALAGVLLLLGLAITGTLLRRDAQEQPGSERMEISFFLRKRETTQILEAIVEAFNQSQDEVTVRTVIVPNPDVELKIRAVNGEFPDLVELIGSSSENIRMYAEGGYLAPLDGTGFLDRVKDGYEPYLEVNGSVYLIPLSVNFRGLFLNCDLLEREGYSVPNSYEELQALLEKIQAAGEQALIFADKDLWTLHQEWDAIYTVEWGSQKEALFMAAEGSQLLQDNEGFVRSLEKFLDLRRFAQEKTWETSYDEALCSFANGEAYMFLQGNWAYSAIKSQNPDIRLAFIPFPTDGGKEAEVVVKVDSSIAVSAACPYPEAAAKFLDYFLSEDVMNDYTERAGGYSCIKGGNGDLSYAESFVAKLEQNAFALDTISMAEGISEVREQGLLKLITGQDADYQIVDFLTEFNDVLLLHKEDIWKNLQ